MTPGTIPDPATTATASVEMAEEFPITPEAVVDVAVIN